MLRIAGAFCLVALASLAHAGLAENGKCRLEGLVTDQAGAPLADVRVRLQKHGSDEVREAWSNALGRWSARDLAQGDWLLVFVRPGYLEQSMVRTVYPRAKLNRTRIAMTKTPFDPGLAEASFEPIGPPEPPGLLPRPEAEDPPDLPEGPPLVVAQALFERGYNRAALRRFEESLRERPDLVSLNQQIGDCYLRLGRYDAALQHYQALHQAAPDSIAALSDLAEVHLKRQDVQQAMVFLRKLVAREPRHPTANYNLAEILLSSDQPEAAIVHYEAAISGRPDWAEAYLKLGYAALSVGRSAKAVEAFHRYLILNPDGPDAPFVRDTIQVLK
jgi:tetratricopeptide (TPR) repeat protein